MADKYSKKDKNFTFRITSELSQRIGETKAKCAQHNIRFNVTEALTKALESELKAVQKHIQKEVSRQYLEGQKTLDLDTREHAIGKAAGGVFDFGKQPPPKQS